MNLFETLITFLSQANLATILLILSFALLATIIDLICAQDKYFKANAFGYSFFISKNLFEIAKLKNNYFERVIVSI